MIYYAYLFEAHTIQPYILNSGKLAEMVGASEIIEYLLSQSGPLDTLLESMQLDHSARFARRGGAAFYVFLPSEEQTLLLMQSWGLVVNGIAPGLQFNHAIAADESQAHAIDHATTQLRLLRNQPQSQLPEAGPWVRRSPRTGTPATDNHREQDGARVWIDAASEVKYKDKFAKGHSLALKFLGSENHKSYEFPRNLDHGDAQFPYRDENHIIGIIHADGNGLGQILSQLSDELENEENYAQIFEKLSQQIDRATQNAAKEALQPVLEIAKEEGHFSNNNKLLIPARPLILGGDDLTIIVRGDLALNYAECFLNSFEEQTRKELTQLHQQYPKIIPEQMTACAGITLLNSNKPFSMGYNLAETLCGHAKNTSRYQCELNNSTLIPSSLCFHRVTSSLIEDYAQVLKRELTAYHRERSYQLTLGAYGCGGFAQGMPAFSELKNLHQLFSQKEMSRGPSRHFLTMMHHDLNESRQIWQRWRRSMNSKSAGLKNALVQYELSRDKLYNNQELVDDLPFIQQSKTAEHTIYQTFLGDLSTWLALGETQQ